jgi:competence protein ComGC
MRTGYKSNGLRALTLVELLVVLAVIVLFVLLVPGDPSARAKAKAMQAACQSNLKQIGIAFRTWEGDHGDKYPMSVPKDKGGSLEYGAGREMFRHFQVMSNELNNPKIMLCPSDDRWFAPAVILEIET